MDRTRRHGDWDDRQLDTLARDLRRLYRPASPVPGHVDRTVLARARTHLRPKTRTWLYRVTAAAAVLLVLVGLVFLETTHTRPSLSGDIDQSGRVDILDALQLARRIEQYMPLDPRWDLNRDGVVDRRDVDTVGAMAVRLDRREVM